MTNENTENTVELVDAPEATLTPDAGAGEAAPTEGTFFVAEEGETVSVPFDA